MQSVFVHSDSQERPTLSDPPLGNLGSINTGFRLKNEEKSNVKSDPENSFRFTDRSFNTAASDSESDSLLYSHTRSESFDPMELGSMASSQGDVRLSYDQGNSRFVERNSLFIVLV